MTHSQPQSHTYYKQADNGLLAHIYEHVAANRIAKSLQSAGLIIIVDYTFWAKTYGTVLYLDFTAHSKSVAKTINTAFIRFQTMPLSFKEINVAAKQVAIEYERPLMQLDEEFVRTIQQFHTRRWIDIKKFTIEKAEVATSVNTVFQLENIRYGRKTSTSFKQLTLHFEVDKKIYENNPAAKVLSILLTQTIALNLHELLAQDYPFYDIGDEWNKGGPTVAYRTTLSLFKQDFPDKDDIQSKINTYRRSLLNNHEVVRNVEKLIKYTYRDEHYRYFSIEAINDITDGIIIGYAGWKSVANALLISGVLEAISVTVID